MIVYGARERPIVVADAMASLGLGLARARPESFIDLLLEAAELAQGDVDALFEARGCDAHGVRERSWMRLLRALAAQAARAAEGQPTSKGSASGAFAALAELELPAEVIARVPEGYVEGSVLPEVYRRAAAALRGVRPLQVIGVRSIGMSLGPLVATAADASADPVTLRALDSSAAVILEEGLGKALLRPGCHYAIVGEGPSDPGFAAVADWLEDREVPLARITFMPSHDGDLGPLVSPRHQRRWAEARRIHLDVDAELRAGAAPLLPRWLGLPDDHPFLDLSAGAWRAEVCGERNDWPVAIVHQERRKYFFEADEPCLVKFEGLGRAGEIAFARAQALAALDLVPAPRSLHHGFLVSRWETATPLSLAREHDRAALLDAVVRYLVALGGDVAGAAERPGAAPARLLAMARFNAAEAIGAELAGVLDRHEEQLRRLSQAARPRAGDNKMHACEWLERPDGTFVKADALDHRCDRTLVGCQDLYWDIAGAEVELDLDADVLLEQLARAGVCEPDPETMAFYRACYLAFQLGRHALAAVEAPAADEAEALREAASDYAARLHQCVLGAA
jgi:hypothetical protein